MVRLKIQRIQRTDIRKPPFYDDQQKNIEEFIHSRDQEVQRLLEKCGKRFYCLNINVSGDGSQISELLEKIEKLVEGSGEKFYRSEVYLETESKIEEMIMWAKERKIANEEREIKVQLEQEVQNTLKKIEAMIQEHEKISHSQTVK